MQPGMMHDRTRNAQSRIDPQTRNARRANGQQRTQLPDQAPQDIGGVTGTPPTGPQPPAYGNPGLADRLAAMRAQQPAGGGRAGGVAPAGGTQPSASPSPAGDTQQPMMIAAPPAISNEMIARYVDELRRRLLFQNGGA